MTRYLIRFFFFLTKQNSRFLPIMRALGIKLRSSCQKGQELWLFKSSFLALSKINIRCMGPGTQQVLFNCQLPLILCGSKVPSRTRQSQHHPRAMHDVPVRVFTARTTSLYACWMESEGKLQAALFVHSL